MAVISIWTGASTFSAGITPFGFYDADPVFINDSDKVAKWCATRLGYPIVNVELQSGSLYTAFEEAITVYGNEIYQWQIRQNYLSMEGNLTSSILNTALQVPSLGTIIRIAKTYGSEAGSGGNVTWHTGSIILSSSIQDYDLNAWATQTGVSGAIEIKRIFNDAPAAIQRYFDPYAGVGTGPQQMFEAFGFGNSSPGISFMMMPINFDVLKIQAIEFNDQIRRSAYSFDLVNNQLRIFPIPSEGSAGARLYFHYILIAERDDITNNSGKGQDNLITNISSVPYTNPTYAHINSIGRQWIYQYTLAIAKEMLGYIRKKYLSIPIPGADVTLNGDDLIAAAIKEKDALLEQLRLNLEETSRSKQLENQASQVDNLQKTLNNIPLPIYIL